MPLQLYLRSARRYTCMLEAHGARPIVAEQVVTFIRKILEVLRLAISPNAPGR